MAWDRKAPFSENGDLLHYHDGWRDDETLKDPGQFEAVMTYTGFQRGRSAAYLVFKDEKGRTYPMFMVEADKVIPLLNQGVVSGVWEVTKRGRNFGIKLVQ